MPPLRTFSPSKRGTPTSVRFGAKTPAQNLTGSGLGKVTTVQKKNPTVAPVRGSSAEDLRMRFQKQFPGETITNEGGNYFRTTGAQDPFGAGRKFAINPGQGGGPPEIDSVSKMFGAPSGVPDVKQKSTPGGILKNGLSLVPIGGGRYSYTSPNGVNFSVSDRQVDSSGEFQGQTPEERQGGLPDPNHGGATTVDNFGNPIGQSDINANPFSTAGPGSEISGGSGAAKITGDDTFTVGAANKVSQKIGAFGEKMYGDFAQEYDRTRNDQTLEALRGGMKNMSDIIAGSDQDRPGAQKQLDSLTKSFNERLQQLFYGSKQYSTYQTASSPNRVGQQIFNSAEGEYNKRRDFFSATGNVQWDSEMDSQRAEEQRISDAKVETLRRQQLIDSKYEKNKTDTRNLYDEELDKVNNAEKNAVDAALKDAQADMRVDPRTGDYTRTSNSLREQIRNQVKNKYDAKRQTADQTYRTENNKINADYFKERSDTDTNLYETEQGVYSARQKRQETYQTDQNTAKSEKQKQMFELQKEVTLKKLDAQLKQTGFDFDSFITQAAKLDDITDPAMFELAYGVLQQQLDTGTDGMSEEDSQSLLDLLNQGITARRTKVTSGLAAEKALTQQRGASASSSSATASKTRKETSLIGKGGGNDQYGKATNPLNVSEQGKAIGNIFISGDPLNGFSEQEWREALINSDPEEKMVRLDPSGFGDESISRKDLDEGIKWAEYNRTQNTSDTDFSSFLK